MSAAKEIINRFRRNLNGGIEEHKELVLAVYGKRKQASLESILAEQFSMSVAVQWEAFINELIVTYVCLHPSRYFKSLNERVKKSLSDRYGPAVAKRIAFSKPSSLRPLLAHAMLDPEGFNISAKSGEKLTTLANERLTAKYARKFALVAADRLFIDFLLALRNYLSHRSKRARKQLVESIERMDPNSANSLLIERVTFVGCYLKTRVGARNDTRATVIARRVIDIAEKLA